MELWSALILGFVGSLHCAGMCGPLMLALPATGNSRASFAATRALYHAGRILTYCLLGVTVGFLGRTLALAGWQRWLSLGAGAAVIVGLLAGTRLRWAAAPVRGVAWLKGRWGALLRHRSRRALFALGGLNGLLPCGLVYAACAGAMATGGVAAAAGYMLAFGLGTLPMLVGVGLLGRRFSSVLRDHQPRLVPVCLALLGFLLVARGLSLGIPYLSPDLSGRVAPCAACQSPAEQPVAAGSAPRH